VLYYKQLTQQPITAVGNVLRCPWSRDEAPPPGSQPTYLAVGTVDEGALVQQVAQEVGQVPGERGHVQHLRHPARHVGHGLVGEAHLQGLVAPLQPAGGTGGGGDDGVGGGGDGGDGET